MAAEFAQKESAPPSPYERILTGHSKTRKHSYGLRSKGTNDWLAIYTVSGAGSFRTPEGEEPALPGDFFLLRPGTPHDYGAARPRLPWEILWAHFHAAPAWHAWTHWPVVTPGVARARVPAGKERQAVEFHLRAMHRSSLTSSSLRHFIGMNALEAALLQCAVLVGESRAKRDARVQEALDYLALHLAEPFSLEDTSRHAGLSTWRFSHLFREELGETPRAFHERLRMERARELLCRTGQPVSEIAFGLGYASEFYFSRRFKLATGQSPSSYRDGMPS